MKRASYREAVRWIADNDNAGNGDSREDVRGYVSTLLVSDLFGVEPDRVGDDVMRLRAQADVDPLDECCRTCKAVPGHPCRDLSSAERWEPHAARVRQAARRAARVS